MKSLTGSAHINEQRRDKENNNDSESEIGAVGLIDKIDFTLYESVPLEELEKKAKEIGGGCDRTPLPYFKGHTFRVFGPEGEKASFYLRFQDNKEAKRVFVNPSRDFKSYRHFQWFLYRLFGRNQYEFAKIYRIDFAVDIPDDFKFIKKIVRANSKRVSRAYLNNGCDVNGLHFGQKPELIAVYNKALEANLSSPKTRIEAQLTGKKRPIETLSELPDLTNWNHTLGDFFRPFKRVCLESYETVSIKSLDSVNDIFRLAKFLSLTDEIGLHLARKKCNRDGKFRRNYEGLVWFKPYPLDLNKVLFRDLCTFFNKERVYQAAEEFWTNDF